MIEMIYKYIRVQKDSGSLGTVAYGPSLQEGEEGRVHVYAHIKEYFSVSIPCSH